MPEEGKLKLFLEIVEGARDIQMNTIAKMTMASNGDVRRSRDYHVCVEKYQLLDYLVDRGLAICRSCKDRGSCRECKED